LKDTMNTYANAKTHEKSYHLTYLMDKVTELYHELTESSNNIHLIPTVVATSHIHMLIYRERLEHGTELFGEDNSEQWKSELYTVYNNYINFFKTIYPQWKSWRYGEVDGKAWKIEVPSTVPPFFTWTAKGKVTDSVTGEKVKFEDANNANEDMYKKDVSCHENRMQNEANAEMASTLVSTWSLKNYLPGKDNEPPVVYIEDLKTFSLGPYGPGNEITIRDNEGKVVKVNIREYNSIDGIQFFYPNNKAGHFSGDEKGGQLHSFPATDQKYIIGFKMRFAKGIMCQIEVMFSDETSSGSLGNRSHWGGTDYSAIADTQYRLICGYFTEGSGPSHTTGTKLIKLKFKHYTLC